MDLHNPLLRVDSYKIPHWLMYPEGMNYMFDYIEARKGARWPSTVFFGLQSFIRKLKDYPILDGDIAEMENFANRHFPAAYRGKIFNKEMFSYISSTYGNGLPVEIKAVPEGTVVPVGNALVTIESTDPKCAALVSYLETAMLRDVWYGTTVATNSYVMKQIILRHLEDTCDDPQTVLPFLLHDFGARGVSSAESAQMGGAAHLVNFRGSDTIEGIAMAETYYGTKEDCAGYSIPASEHSVMGSRGPAGELAVMRQMLDIFGVPDGIFACVCDTYSLQQAVGVYWGEVLREDLLKSEARLVVRPDSGDPVESVLLCLNLLAEKFGAATNKKGYKVLHPCVRVIQGDGIEEKELDRILTAVKNAGYSTENVAAGSGGGLLQKVNRDTERFAMKCSFLEIDGQGQEVYKQPATDISKSSMKGKLSLFRDRHSKGYITEDPAKVAHLLPGHWNMYEEALVPVYRNGEILKSYTLDEVRRNTGLW